MTNNIFPTKAVIFDRDGVIINTEGLIINSVKEAFSQLGIECPQDYMEKLPGRGPDIFKDLTSKIPSFNFEEFRSIQRSFFYQNLDKIEIFEPAVSLIKSLYAKNIPVAVTTSANKEGTELLLKMCGVRDALTVLVTKEDCKNTKPDPEPYLLTASKLNIDPKYCVVLEDTALGVEAAKRAGMYCFAIPNEYTKHQDFSLADRVLESADEVEKLLQF